MTDKDVASVAKFITALRVHFMRPKAETEDDRTVEKEWMRSMMRSLGGYDADVLEKAAADILANRTDRRFPLPAECKKACDEVLKWKQLASPKLQDQAVPNDKYEWAYKLADDLICGPLGREAARDGWILSLHDFIRNNQRLPVEHWEITKCKTSARGFDEAYDAVLRGEGGEVSKMLEKLGDSMMAKRERYREKVLGK